MEVVLSDAALWQKYSKVLPSNGLCVDKIRACDVPESMICEYFGPKSSKSGWKYNNPNKISVEESASILNLWQQVYDTHEMPNKEITLQFARGVIMQSRCPEGVNWTEFAIGRQRHREALKGKKGVKVDDLGEGVGEGKKVSVLGKKRCLAARSVEGVLPLFKLSIKKEGPGDVVDMGKKESVGSLGRGKGSRGKVLDSPSWIQSELREMEVVLEKSQSLVTELTKKLEEGAVDKRGLEGEVRRAKMHMSDRMVMLEEAELEVAKLLGEESFLNSQISEKRMSLLGGEDRETLRAALEADEAKCEEVAFNRQTSERGVHLSSKIVYECKETIASAESHLVQSNERHNLLSARVSSMGSLLGCMEEHLQRMKEGGGHAFFPRPISNNPEMPVSTVHALNACPVCGFWYICYNFVPLGCGHTYHQFCLSEHSKKERACLVESCKQPFLLESIAAIGIRPTNSITLEQPLKLELPSSAGTSSGSKQPSESIQIEALSVKGTGNGRDGDGNPMSSGVSWDSYYADKSKGMLLSQSSETNIVAAPSGVQSAISNQNKPNAMCPACQKKPIAVAITGCKHDMFCFGCIQGKQCCPLCSLEILGWEKIKPQPKLGPMILAPVVGWDADAMMEPVGAEAEMVPVEADDNDHASSDFDALLDGSSEDEQERGCIHWSSDQDFFQGGRRSVEANIESQESEQDEKTVVEASMAKDLMADTPTAEASLPMASNKRGKKRVAIVSAVIASEVVPQNSAPRKGQRHGKSVKSQPQLENHTRIVSRALNDILSCAPSQGHRDEPVHAPPKKRGPGRPPSRAKGPILSHQQSACVHEDTVLSTGPRSASGRERVIPSRFRGP